MLSSFFEGMTPTDIAHQYAEEESNVPPNLDDVPLTRYPWGDNIQMPSNISFKALKIIILNEDNAKKYNISKKFVDDFQGLSDKYDVAVAEGKTTEKNMYHAQGRTFYKVSKIYDAVRKYHSENP